MLVRTSIFALTILAGSALAQNPMIDPGTKPPEQPAPTIPSALTFDSLVHDWGAISDDDPVSHKFTFKNTSAVTVNIKDTKTSCGCSVAAPSKRTLAPGEEATIDVTYTPKGKRGQELKTITVITDYASSPNVELHLKAFVRPRMVIEPSSIWFGDIALRKAATQELTISNRTEGFTVTSFELKDSDKFTVEKIAEENADLDGQPVRRVKFKLGFKDSNPLGTHQSNFIITTNDPKNPTYTIAIGARVSGDLHVAPERMIIPMRGPSLPWQAETIIASKNNQPFEVYSIEAIDCTPEMHVVVDLLPRDLNSKSGFRVRAAGTTPALPEAVKGTVRVRTNVKDMEIIDIPLQVFSQMAPKGGIPGVGGQLIVPNAPK